MERQPYVVFDIEVTRLHVSFLIISPWDGRLKSAELCQHDGNKQKLINSVQQAN